MSGKSGKKRKASPPPPSRRVTRAMWKRQAVEHFKGLTVSILAHILSFIAVESTCWSYGPYRYMLVCKQFRDMILRMTSADLPLMDYTFDALEDFRPVYHSRTSSVWTKARNLAELPPMPNLCRLTLWVFAPKDRFSHLWSFQGLHQLRDLSIVTDHNRHTETMLDFSGMGPFPNLRTLYASFTSQPTALVIPSLRTCFPGLRRLRMNQVDLTQSKVVIDLPLEQLEIVNYIMHPFLEVRAEEGGSIDTLRMYDNRTSRANGSTLGTASSSPIHVKHLDLGHRADFSLQTLRTLGITTSNVWAIMCDIRRFLAEHPETEEEKVMHVHVLLKMAMIPTLVRTTASTTEWHETHLWLGAKYNRTYPVNVAHYPEASPEPLLPEGIPPRSIYAMPDELIGQF